MPQLNINYANEKLQQFFIFCIFKVEEAAHKEDDVFWPQIPLPDNQVSIDLIGGEPNGVLKLLDEASRLSSAKESALFEQINEKNRKSRAFKVAPKKRPSEAFGIKHYAGDVIYSCAEASSATWLEKNSYALSPEVEATLSKSKLHEFFSPIPEDAPKPGKKAAVRTVCRDFMKNVGELVATLNAVEAQFVRCIKPNVAQEPMKSEQKLVLAQVRNGAPM